MYENAWKKPLKFAKENFKKNIIVEIVIGKERNISHIENEREKSIEEYLFAWISFFLFFKKRKSVYIYAYDQSVLSSTSNKQTNTNY